MIWAPQNWLQFNIYTEIRTVILTVSVAVAVATAMAAAATAATTTTTNSIVYSGSLATLCPVVAIFEKLSPTKNPLTSARYIEYIDYIESERERVCVFVCVCAHTHDIPYIFNIPD